MTGVPVPPAGFAAFATLTAIAILLALAVLVQRARGRAVRGPLAAFAATALLYLLLVIAEQFRFRTDAAMAFLRFADDWMAGWGVIAGAIWWAASRR